VTAAEPWASAPAEFLLTAEYLRFAEFCDACRDSRYIGLCYGVPGVGKTVSARHYAHWDQLEAILGPPPYRSGDAPPQDSGPWRTVLYTPAVSNTPRSVEREVGVVWSAVNRLAARQAWHGPIDARVRSPELVIVDEADRLKTASLEQLRDLYDRRQIGLVLIGMPGLQKRLARYAQLYSRVGFVHHFRSLTGQELQQVIERQTVQLGLGLEAHESSEADVVSAIARVTRGNFRLIERLFAQIERVVHINELSSITPEVVAVASESLVIGPI
jgi:DNA transposition AAA+ family ATPase